MPVHLQDFSFQVQWNVNWINKEELTYLRHCLDMRNLIKECVILGVSSRIEIWSKDLWEDYFAESEESFAEIAENMIDFDI